MITLESAICCVELLCYTNCLTTWIHIIGIDKRSNTLNNNMHSISLIKGGCCIKLNNLYSCDTILTKSFFQNGKHVQLPWSTTSNHLILLFQIWMYSYWIIINHVKPVQFKKCIVLTEYIWDHWTSLERLNGKVGKMKSVAPKSGIIFKNIFWISKINHPSIRYTA